LRTTDNLVPVPSLALFPVTTGVGILSSTGTGESGLFIGLAASRVTTKIGVSRLVRVLEWVASRSVAGM